MAAPRKHRVEDSQFNEIVAQSLSIAPVLGKLGLVPAGGNYKTVQTRTTRLRIDTGHFTGSAWNTGSRYRSFGRKASSSEVLIGNSTYAFTHGLKRRLIKEGWKKHQCEECGREQWRGQLIPLELHHQNGVSNDHRIENLQLLCPNCHALTGSYRGRNKLNG
jgi:5-methylcytosine-specific restriction endonuclease McrA